MMFTKEEAFTFIKDILHVRDAEERVKCDRKTLLDEIAISIQSNLYFQNFRLLSSPPEKRCKPTLEEIKADILSGIGGLCFNINLSAFYILQAIGFDTSVAHATCTSSVLFPNNHVVIFIENVEKQGDKFLMEVAFGFPTFRVISLDFEKESPVFSDSFIEYKYIREGEHLLRMHRKGDLVRRPVSERIEGLDYHIGDWRRFYYAELRSTKDVSEFDKDMESVFINPKATPFFSSLRIIGFPDKKAVMVINAKTLIENEKGELEATEIQGGTDGIISKIHQLFPKIPKNLADSAVANWKKFTS